MPQRVKPIRRQRRAGSGQSSGRRVSGAAFFHRNPETCSASTRSKWNVSHRAPERGDPMTLTLEDDTVLRLLPLVVITCGGRDYLALTPEEKKNENVYFYEFITHPEGGIELRGIGEKEVLDTVLDEFEVWFDEQLRVEGE